MTSTWKNVLLGLGFLGTVGFGAAYFSTNSAKNEALQDSVIKTEQLEQAAQQEIQYKNEIKDHKENIETITSKKDSINNLYVTEQANYALSKTRIQNLGMDLMKTKGDLSIAYTKYDSALKVIDMQVTDQNKMEKTINDMLVDIQTLRNDSTTLGTQLCEWKNFGSTAYSHFNTLNKFHHALTDKFSDEKFNRKLFRVDAIPNKNYQTRKILNSNESLLEQQFEALPK